MKIGELFLEIGLKGSDATARGLENTSKAIKDVASDALKATAAVSALFYGFRKLAGQSEQTGLGLSQFSDITGLSSDELQRWQQLAIHFGESAEQMTGDIKTVQKAMTDTVLKGNYPEYLRAINIALTNAGKEGINTQNARDTYGVMNKLREYARLPSSQANKDIAKAFLGSTGISEQTIGALFTSKFNLNNPDKSRMYSQGQTGSLARLSVGWTEFFDRIEHSLGKLNVQFGPKILKEFNAVLPAMESFVKTLAQTAEQLHLIEGMGDAFTKLTAVLESIARVLGYTNTHTPLDLVKDLAKNAHGTAISDKFNELVFGNPAAKLNESALNKAQQNTINVQVHGVEGDSGSIGAEIAAHVSAAFRQLPQGGSSGGGH